MPMKFYAVVKGYNTGIFDTWHGPAGTYEQVNGYPNAIFRGFSERESAERWYRWMTNPALSPTRKLTEEELARCGYAVEVNLKPYDPAAPVERIGSIFSELKTWQDAKMQGLVQLWTPEHDKRGRPKVFTLFLKGFDVIFFHEGGLNLDEVPMRKPVNGRWP